MKKVITGLMVVLLSVLVLGCAAASDESDGAVVAAEFTSALAAGLADLSPADFSDLNQAPKTAIAPAVPASAPDWWYLINPLRKWQLEEAVEIAEAPGKIFAYYVIDNNPRPSCASTTPNPFCTLDPSTPGGTCDVTLTFTADCPVTFMVNGVATTFKLSGSLTREAAVTTASSGALVWDGKWTTALSAANFKVKEPTLNRYIVYNGLIDGAGDGTSAVAPYDWRFNWTGSEPTAPNIVNWLGDKLSTYGSHQLSVAAGSSVDTLINAFPSFRLATGRVLRAHRQVERKLKLLTATTASLGIVSTLTNLGSGAVWTRNANLSLEKLSALSLRINGNNSIGAPGGHTYGVELVNVVIDAGNSVPVSGSAKIKIDGVLTFTVYFTGQCDVDYDKAAGGTGRLNLCAPVAQ